MQRSKGCIAAIVFFIFGVLLVVGGFVLPIVLEKQLQSGIVNNIVVDSTSSAGYESWTSNNGSDSAPLYENFYFFNVTNPDDVIAGNDLPILVQCGPYSYRYYKVKFDISFNSDGSQTTYKQWMYYVLNNETTRGNPYTDKITTVNIPLLAVQQYVGYNWWQSLILSLLVSSSSSNLFVTHTPHELLWGYTDPLLAEVAKVNPSTSSTFSLQQNYTSVDQADQQRSFDTQWTGSSDISKIDCYTKYQNHAYLQCWATDSANKVQGADASQYPPGVSTSQSLLTWVDSAYRSTDLIYNNTVDCKGISLYRFVLSPDSLAPNPDYWGFGLYGVLNLTACANAPIFLSKPHFLDADPSYADGVIGMHPNRALHDTAIDVEPISGATMRVAKRLQVNLLMNDILLLYPNISLTYHPVMWAEEASELTDAQASEFISQVYGVRNWENYSSWIGWGSGAFVAVVSIIVFIFIWRRSSTDEKNKRLYVRVNDSEDTPIFHDNLED